jgi:hypothetical protein
MAGRKPAKPGTVRFSGTGSTRRAYVATLSPEGKTKWVPRARWVWQTQRGPIAPGWVVLHWNGDPCDDRLANLCLGRRGDNLAIALDTPRVAERQRKRRAAGVATANRYRSEMARGHGYLATWWYAVCRRQQVVIDAPAQSATALRQQCGDGQRMPAGLVAVRGATLREDMRYRGYRRASVAEMITHYRERATQSTPGDAD